MTKDINELVVDETTRERNNRISSSHIKHLETERHVWEMFLPAQYE